MHIADSAKISTPTNQRVANTNSHGHRLQYVENLAHAPLSNAKVSDGSQPPMTFDLSLSESAGSHSLHRLAPSFPVPALKLNYLLDIRDIQFGEIRIIIRHN